MQTLVGKTIKSINEERGSIVVAFTDGTKATFNSYVDFGGNEEHCSESHVEVDIVAPKYYVHKSFGLFGSKAGSYVMSKCHDGWYFVNASNVCQYIKNQDNWYQYYENSVERGNWVETTLEQAFKK